MLHHHCCGPGALLLTLAHQPTGNCQNLWHPALAQLSLTLACSGLATPSSGKIESVSAMNSLSGHSRTMALTLTPLLLLIPAGRAATAWPTLTPEKAGLERVLRRCCRAIVMELLLLLLLLV
jgi:hypothetical protein